MKTLIIYSTTYGYAEECAFELAEKISGEALCININKENAPSVQNYDNIIIGGSVYMGQIQKKVKEYCNLYTNELTTKRLGLFICCAFPEKFETFMQSSFPKELIDCAVSKQCFGGELNVNKMKFVHRFITNIVKKSAEKEGNGEPVKLHENIESMAHIINK